MQNSTIQAFFALVQAGLWEQDVTLSQFGEVNYAEVLRFAEEQSVVGLVAAGLEHVEDVKVPKEDVLQFVGIALQIEQKNQAMNAFIAEIVEKMCKSDIYTLLVKGQGIAQCYERPLWRSCGDVDFLLSEENYKKAKFFLKRIATNVEEENKKSLHLGLVIDSWMVELHGTLRSNCLRKMDRIIDEVQNDVFYGGNVRSWMNNITPVFLPSSNNDVFFVFTHILKHFFHGGIGLRQICDWCRLLSALETVKEKMANEEKSALDIWKQALDNITPQVEVKSRRIGGATFQVPTEIRADRKESISMKNMIIFARKRGGKGMADKLAAEIMDAYNNQGGAFKRKEDMHRMAEANRAFAHFRF